MSDENQTQEPAVTEQLQRSIEALERKNKELADEKRKLRKFEQMAEQLPDGIDINELLDFKRRAEQAELESQGKYTEARQVFTPAVTALAEIVHDPDLVLKSKLSADQIEREADGTVVVVNGYQRTPVAEWAKTLPAWMQKQPKPQGSGAPSGNAPSSLPIGVKNPFAPESFNLTEQARLFKTDRDLYERFKANR
ncbi:MAG: hypothetical protein EBT99_16925 [Betaproteobacteria bacterium]|nr:hypothetical protein [Betaproteobacteria bacterium]